MTGFFIRMKPINCKFVHMSPSFVNMTGVISMSDGTINIFISEIVHNNVRPITGFLNLKSIFSRCLFETC